MTTRISHAAAALLLATCAATSAHATMQVSTSGATTTYSETFDGGSSFTGGTRIPGLGGDDFLFLNAAASAASYTFTSASAIAALDLSFWYASRNGQGGSVTLSTFNQTLGNTPGNVAQFGGNNPGPQTGGLFNNYDAYFSQTLTNLAAGTYVLTFAKGAGAQQSFKLDDVKFTVTAVPEPSTYALMFAGLGLVGWAARRKRQDQR
jgi:hypothetical protein